MKITDFDMYQDLLQEKSGLILTQDKASLLESRLRPISKKWGYDTLDAMTMAMYGVPDPALIQDIVEAMTMNDTSFFRDREVFHAFKEDVLHYMKQARKAKKLIIWCAACSSGQEPYSLAMLLKERAADFPSWKFEILATDISGQVLEQAREGRYTQFESQRGLPVRFLMKYFELQGEYWQLSDDIRKMVTFKEFNLLNPMNKMGSFDMIFCGHVLPDFEDETKSKILDNLAAQLTEDGFLFLGEKEDISGLSDALLSVPDTQGVYARNGSPHIKAAQTDTQALA